MSNFNILHQWMFRVSSKQMKDRFVVSWRQGTWEGGHVKEIEFYHQTTANPIDRPLPLNQPSTTQAIKNRSRNLEWMGQLCHQSIPTYSTGEDGNNGQHQLLACSRSVLNVLRTDKPEKDKVVARTLTNSVKTLHACRSSPAFIRKTAPQTSQQQH